MSFPQAELVGNPSDKKDSRRAGMTKLGSSCVFTNDRINICYGLDYELWVRLCIGGNEQPLLVSKENCTLLEKSLLNNALAEDAVDYQVSGAV